MNTALTISILEMFLLGAMLGYMAADRQKPNEPKPKDWEAKLQKRWMDGFKAGEKSMVRRMSTKLKEEEILQAMWGKDDETN